MTKRKSPTFAELRRDEGGRFAMAPRCYVSLRSASSGSTRTARRAGR